MSTEQTLNQPQQTMDPNQTPEQLQSLIASLSDQLAAVNAPITHAPQLQPRSFYKQIDAQVDIQFVECELTPSYLDDYISGSNFIMPGFDVFINSALTKYRSAIPSPNQQIRAIWTHEGLVMYSPKPQDKSYITPRLMRTNDSNQPRREFGHWTDVVLLPWGNGALQTLTALTKVARLANHTLATGMRKYTTRTDSHRQLRAVTNDRTMRYDNYFRAMRFITTGIIMSGNKPKIDFYQFFAAQQGPDFMNVQHYQNCDVQNYQAKDIPQLHQVEEFTVDGKVHKVMSQYYVWNFLDTKFIQTGGSISLVGQQDRVENPDSFSLPQFEEDEAFQLSK